MNSERKQRGLPRIMMILIVLPVLALACRISIPDIQPEISSESVETFVATVVPEMPQGEEIIENIVKPAIILEENEALVDLYARANPSVVNITVFSQVDDLVLPASQGSGFVYDSDGNIITNAHVVHGASEVEVTFSDGTARVAQIVGEDLNSDLAVVRVEALPAGVGPIPLGDMESLAVGQTVIAIGNPFGLEGTLTRGVISALGRTIPALTVFTIPQSIQTDAAINPGNSGGPLLNLQGEVIGVNAQIETDGTSRSNLGVGFAIPVNIVKHVVPDLVQSGEHEWPWLGVQGGDVSPLLVEAMSLPIDKGAYISNIIEDGPSSKSALRGSIDSETIRGRQIDTGGDIITAVNGQTVNSFDDLLIYIALEVAPGDEVILKVYRNGEYIDVPVTLEKRPESMRSTLEP
jgi:2-alkenal reductase